MLSPPGRGVINIHPIGIKKMIEQMVTSIAVIEEPRLGLGPVFVLGRVAVAALTLCPPSPLLLLVLTPALP